MNLYSGNLWIGFVRLKTGSCDVKMVMNLEFLKVRKFLIQILKYWFLKMNFARMKQVYNFKIGVRTVGAVVCHHSSV